ncbi:hypothetical protein [Tsukamurella paurometabola]|uniref:Uncharacterized protein n=1 Tax=Tsukamurella paurometabola TaxID=2061 RepID=A0ABS5NIX5_TSUPA|nr:hypothetical protein [Tsukamurella paurometabola]MBS4104220.1 hypothetical protein [Tsukamurella paurometabola]
MTFFSLTCDLLISTDRSRTVGSTVDAVGPSISRAVTAGMVRLLEDAIFSADTSQAPRWSQMCERAAQAPGGADGLERYLASSHSWEISDTRHPLGQIETSSDDSDGVAMLGESAAWRPAGEIRVRTYGAHRIYFVESELDLAGAMTPDLSIDAVPLVSVGSELSLIEAGGACGVCGACGACAICGEINAAAPVAAGAAITAVTHVFRPEYSPVEAKEAAQEALTAHLRSVGVADRVTFPSPAAAR